jgi:hypothetical protein
VKTVKQLLRPERLRQVPEQFSWIDQALVQRHFIDRCDARAAALYLFLITVADAQGLSYYGGAALTQRLHLSTGELGAARRQLIELDLIAYRAPLCQVLALPGLIAPRTTSSAAAPAARDSGGPVSIAQLLGQLEHRRGRL